MQRNAANSREQNMMQNQYGYNRSSSEGEHSARPFKNKKITKQMDVYLLFLVLTLTVIGLIMILSSSYYSGVEKYQDGFYNFKRQFMWALIGTSGLLIMSCINYKIIKKCSAIAYWGSFILSLAVLFVGTSSKGATRWLQLGPIGFQPSEIAKIGLIAYLSYILSTKKQNEDGSPWNFKEYGREFFYMGLLTLPILVENISTGILMILIGCTLIAVSGLKLEKLVFYLAIPAIVILVLYIKAFGLHDIASKFPKYEKRIMRIETWLDPFADAQNAGFQTVQSQYAIGSGGLLGVGLGKSKQKLGYIPEAHNDIIFAIICEEFGLIGATFIIVMFSSLIARCVWISMHSPDKFSAYFVMGIAALLAWEVLINIGVVTGALPTTGMALPFISYGGTSLFVLMSSLGIILNISKYTD